MSRRRTSPTAFAVLVQDFFSSRLINEKNVSPRTVASYRDTFRLLFRYAESQSKRQPAKLVLADLDAKFILSFLNHLERVRDNSARTRNLRLAAIRSFMRYASFRDPSALPIVQRVLAIPLKRFERPLVGYLSRNEMEAILSAPNCSTWTGRRDQILLRTMYNTGVRVSEVITLHIADVVLGTGAHIRVYGKGRKERTIPLWGSTSKALRSWLSAHLNPHERAPLFTNRRGKALSRSGVQDRLQVAVRSATQTCPTLAERRISPHTVRHTTAMHLLQSGVDITVIALWLGHESPATTHQYVEADLMMKERALARLQEVPHVPTRYRASDALLKFLDSL